MRTARRWTVVIGLVLASSLAAGGDAVGQDAPAPTTAADPAVVLRADDGREQVGTPGRVAWNEWVQYDFRPFAPVAILDLAVGQALELDASALGSPALISFRVYAIDATDVQEQRDGWIALDSATCASTFAELEPAAEVALPLPSTGGEHVVVVYLNFADGRYEWFGFHVRLEGDQDGRVASACAPPADAAPEGFTDATPTTRWVEIVCPEQVSFGEVASLLLRGTGPVWVIGPELAPPHLSPNALLLPREGRVGVLRPDRPVALAWWWNLGGEIVDYAPDAPPGDNTPSYFLQIRVKDISVPNASRLAASCTVEIDYD